jgi:magnesium-transporting ATPase (P-type)
MPKLTSHGKIFRDWEALLGACEKNVNALTGVEPLRTEMETFLVQARELKLQQENFNGNKKATTQQLRELIDRGTEVSRMLRAFVVSRIGTKTELGKMFGLVPTGRKARKKSKTPVAKPPAAPPATAAASLAEPPNPVQTKGEEG